MSIATYNLTVRCTGGGEALPGATVEARLTRPDYTADGGNFPISQRATADENGVAVLALVSNLVGTQDSRYTVVVRTAAGQFLDSREIQMPEADSTLAQLVEELPVNTDTQTAAAISADLAEKWATGTEPGGAGTQSSREWAGDAEVEAGNAATSATEAGNAESGALAAESGAVDAENAAAGSAALSEKWATGTEPGGVGTKSAREEAERAEAAADVLPDPVGQDAGLGVQTDGAGGYNLTILKANAISALNGTDQIKIFDNFRRTASTLGVADSGHTWIQWSGEWGTDLGIASRTGGDSPGIAVIERTDFGTAASDPVRGQGNIEIACRAGSRTGETSILLAADSANYFRAGVRSGNHLEVFRVQEGTETLLAALAFAFDGEQIAPRGSQLQIVLSFFVERALERAVLVVRIPDLEVVLRVRVSDEFFLMFPTVESMKYVGMYNTEDTVESSRGFTAFGARNLSI